MAEVVVEYGGKEILRLPLKGPTMIIGRDPTCDVHLDNKALSRRHAQIEKRGAAIWVRDLQSQNGTFVNGERIGEPQALNGGDRISVGRYEVTITGVEEARRDTPVLTLSGPEGRHRFAMVGDEIIIGRAPSCDIAIGHKSISRRHLRIASEGDHFIAEDLGSQNGSRINNKRINGPTPFRMGDKVQMSEFTIEVGYYESPETNGGGPPRSGKTMLIDKSELAKAAYVDGDMNVGDGHGNISLGQSGTPAHPAQEHDHGRDDLEPDGETSGLDLPPPPPPPPPPPRGRQPPPPQPPPPQPPPPQPPPPQPPQQQQQQRRPPAHPLLTVSHPDLQERTLLLDGDITVLGEDGSDGDSSGERSFANQAYLVFVRSQRGVTCCVAGDRRLLMVNGQPQLTTTLREGDTLELGVLTVVFHHQG